MEPHLLELETCTVDLAARVARHHDGRQITLTQMEVDLLGYLAARPSAVVTRSELLQQVWGYAPTVKSRAVDNAVRRLREKIEPPGDRARHVQTVHREGYRFEPVHAAAPAPPEPRVQAAAPPLRLGDSVVDLSRLELLRGGERTSLSTTEADVLRVLSARRGALISLRALQRQVWPSGASDSAVRVCIRRLREKIERDPSDPKYILSERGKGYRLVAGQEEDLDGSLAMVLVSVDGLEDLWRHAPEVAGPSQDVLERTLEAVGGAVAAGQDGDRYRFVFADPAAALTWCLAVQTAMLRASWPEAALDLAACSEHRSPAGTLLFRGLRISLAMHAGELHRVPGRQRRYRGEPVAVVEGMSERCPVGWIGVSEAAWAALPVELQRQVVVGRHVGGLVLAVHKDLEERAVSLGRPMDSREPATSFVGRGEELQRLRDWLAGDPGLVTLMGPGGVGKTRLALRIARSYGRAVWWCDLAHASDVEQAVDVLGLAVGVQRPTAARVARVLEVRGGGLLVLDNTEQIAAARELVATLSEHAPSVHLLVTTRIGLGLEGEQVMELGPLETDAAVGLFLDRASGPTADREHVRALVERLDHLPLALELAASRTPLMSPKDLLERLHRRFDVLHKTEVGRHGSLRAALDWSWDLMRPWEREALCQLSVFRASFSLADAEEVVQLGEGAPDCLTVLDALTQQSLLLAHGGASGRRLSMLESIRDYARERLPDGEPPREQMLRYARWMARWGADESLIGLDGPDGAARRSDLAAAGHDLVHAGWWCVAQGLPELAARCAVGAAQILQHTLHAKAVVRMIGEILTGLPEDLEVRALIACGRTRRRLAEDDPQALHELRLAHSKARDRWARLHSAAVLGHALMISAPDEALELLGHALDLARRLGDRSYEGSILLHLASRQGVQESAEEATTAFREALRCLRESGNEEGEANGLLLYAHTLRRAGRLAQAQSMTRACLAKARASERLPLVGAALQLQALLARDLGDLSDAERLTEEASRIRLRDGRLSLAASSLGALAVIRQRLGDEAGSDRAARRAQVLPASPTFQGRLHAHLAERCHLRGEHRQMVEHAEAARELMGAYCPPWLVAQLDRLRAEGLFTAGSRDEALIRATEALERAIGASLHAEVVACHALLARLRWQVGEPEPARAHLEAARAVLTELRPGIRAECVAVIEAAEHALAES